MSFGPAQLFRHVENLTRVNTIAGVDHQDKQRRKHTFQQHGTLAVNSDNACVNTGQMHHFADATRRWLQHVNGGVIACQAQVF